MIPRFFNQCAINKFTYLFFRDNKLLSNGIYCIELTLNTFKLFIGSMFQDNRTKFTKIFYFMNKKAPSFQKAL
ncbi:hypothetical protein M9Y90_02615 [Leptospira interrogans]|uniref:hypothetical protein n=1 Tax=Leptospira interrogans TaxID=173 RepID=UPI00202342E5|nr:hypothetical protein [Leptospira interrogans]MCL8309570.1 hypothetical protein [Leptospira interrogans]